MMEIDELIDYLIDNIKRTKEYADYYMNLHHFTNETIYQGELTAYLEIAKYIYIKTNNEKLHKFLYKQYEY